MPAHNSYTAAQMLKRSTLRHSICPAVETADSAWRRSMYATAWDIVRWTPEFRVAGLKQRHFFPHRFYCLPKCGPDGYRLARRMCGVRQPGQLWQIVLFATGPVLAEFPKDLFLDDDLNWHEQHLNRIGQIASVTLAIDQGTLYTMAHQSDLVQRISRRREFKTRIEQLFHGWHRLLLNAIANFALANGYRQIRVPSSALAMKYTDRHRQVRPELFERVYDRAVSHQFQTIRSGDWWNIDLNENRDAVIAATPSTEHIKSAKTICLFHDIERGAGHRRSDPGLAARADREAPQALHQMLKVEQQNGVRTTYNVLGNFLDEVRCKISAGGHCIAFHSYNHTRFRQLAACRRTDYRIKGYRPPQSRVGRELRDTQLCWHNFEWLMSSRRSLGIDFQPQLQNRLAKIPVRRDDFALYRERMDFAKWEQEALS